MPIYEYQCSACNTVFEEWLKASEIHEKTPCPDCGGEAVHIISNTAFVLKGGGWYVTDYGYRKGVNEGTGSAESSAAGKTATQGTDAGANDNKAVAADTGTNGKTTPGANGKTVSAATGPSAGAGTGAGTGANASGQGSAAAGTNSANKNRSTAAGASGKSSAAAGGASATA